MKRALVLLGALPSCAWAHGFAERHDLPVPLAWFVAAAAATVALSLLVAVFFARRAPAADFGGHTFTLGEFPRALRVAFQIASTGLFLLTVAAALWGTADPMMNLAPTLVLVVWWVGLALAVVCFGNFWPAVDPWAAIYEALNAAARRLGRPQGASLGWHWPRSLGLWPAVAILLLWGGFEVVYPIAAVPSRLGWVALAWSVLTLTGMVCFGRETWQRNADAFAIYFAVMGRLAPMFAVGGEVRVRPVGAELIVADRQPPPAGEAAFIVAMLSTVLFDGLHGGQAWPLFEQRLARFVPSLMDANGYFAGAVGLVAVWLAFYAAYHAACGVTAKLARGSGTARVAGVIAPTLIPIAVAYNVAHNFSILLEQGCNAIPLLSDPLGRHWNLFGTAGLYPDVGGVEATLTWYVALGAIVLGHTFAVWLGHRVMLREFGAPGRAAIASIPLTALMIAYTAVSLLLIAEPMVSFEVPVAR